MNSATGSPGENQFERPDRVMPSVGRIVKWSMPEQRENRLNDVSRRMTWYPVATFWQVTMDMVFSSSMPDGYGHHYGLELADAWSTLAPPAGWTTDDTARLRAAIVGIDP